MPPTSMVISLLPRVHVLPSHHCYSTGRQRSPLVILRPFLPLPNLFSLLHAAGVILLKYKCVHVTSLTLNPSSVLVNGIQSRHLPKLPGSCVTCSPLSSPCPLCSRSTEHLSVPRISQALSCLRVSYVLFQSHGKLFAQLTDIFNNFSRWIFFLMSTHVSEQRAASLLRKGPNSKYFWLCGPVSVCQYCSTQPIVAWKQP